MYRITKPNDCSFTAGQSVPDKEYVRLAAEIRAGGGLPANAVFLPSYKWKIYDRQTGAECVSRTKYTSALACIFDAVRYLTRVLKLGRASTQIVVTEDETADMLIDIAYV